MALLLLLTSTATGRWLGPDPPISSLLRFSGLLMLPEPPAGCCLAVLLPALASPSAGLLSGLAACCSSGAAPALPVAVAGGLRGGTMASSESLDDCLLRSMPDPPRSSGGVDSPSSCSKAKPSRQVVST